MCGVSVFMTIVGREAGSSSMSAVLDCCCVCMEPVNILDTPSSDVCLLFCWFVFPATDGEKAVAIVTAFINGMGAVGALLQVRRSRGHKEEEE